MMHGLSRQRRSGQRFAPVRKNTRHAIAISLALAIFVGFFIGAQPRARAAEPTVENPVLFTVRGKLVNGGTSIQYDIDIDGVYAGQSYLSANIVYPVQLTLNTTALASQTCSGSVISNCWSISTQSSSTYSTTNFIWRGTTSAANARTAAQLAAMLEPLYFTLTNPGVFPPDPSTVAIEASPDKITQYVDEAGFVHWYVFIKQSTVSNWLVAYNAAKAARMQDPRYPDDSSKQLKGYLATITSHAEQMKIYRDIATECGWLGGTRMLRRTADNATTAGPILDETSLPATANQFNTKFMTNGGTSSTYGSNIQTRYWYWADGPEAGLIFFTEAKATSQSGPTCNGSGVCTGSSVTHDAGRTPVTVTGTKNGSGAVQTVTETSSNIPTGFKGWSNYSFFGSGEPNNSDTTVRDGNNYGEYALQFAFATATAPTASADRNIPSYGQYANSAASSVPANDLVAAARWNDYSHANMGSMYGYYIEYGGYPDDPTAKDLGNVTIQSISTVDLVMPIQIRYRSTEGITLDPETYESHRQMTGLGTGNDRLITYEKDLPYTAVRDVTPQGGQFTPPAGYTYYDWEFMGNPVDESNLSADANSVSGFHSQHYQYITFLYQPVNVQVSFNANFEGWNSASVTPQTKAVKYDTPYGELATATRPGYTFAGWYTAASGGTLVDPATVVNQTTAHTLYAHWTEQNDYTVSYDVACPSGATCTPATIADKTGVRWTSTGLLPSTTPTASGQVFVGWDVVPTGSEPGKQGVTNSDVYSSLAASASGPGITLRAQWRPADTIQVIYHLNGATSPTSLDDQTVLSTDVVVQLPQPIRPGFTFQGWKVVNNGHGDALPGVVSENQVYGPLALKNGTYATFIILEAQWTPNTYTVNYNGNGATWSAAPKTGVHWEDNGFTPPAEGNPTRTGYVFMGWKTSNVEGQGVAANAGTTYSVLADGDDQIASVTLYAQWQAERTYFVRYDVNGGSPAISDKTGVLFGQSNLLPETPTPPAGYAFSGWKVTYNGSKNGVVSTDTFGGLAADPNAGFIVLQAQYSPTQRYQIQYNVNGGNSGYTPASKGYSTNNLNDPKYPEIVWTQSNLLPLVDPVKTGGSVGGVTCSSSSPCTFLGWNTKADGSGRTVIPADTYGDIATASGGVTQCTAPVLGSTAVQQVGTPTTAAATSLTLPTHQPGDMIVIIARRGSTSAPSVPSASGTVPQWNLISPNTAGVPATGANTLNQVVAYTIATASNHTSGTWTNANHLIAVVLRATNNGNLSIGGYASQNNNSSTSIARPNPTNMLDVPTSGGQLYLTAVSKAAGNTTTASGATAIQSAASSYAGLYSETSKPSTPGAFTNASATATTVTSFQVIASFGGTPTSSAGCTVLYAIFASANSFTVIYDLNGGIGSISNATLGSVLDSVPLPTPTAPTGYVFSHWYVSNNGNGMSNPAHLAAGTPYGTLVYGDGSSSSPYKNTITLRAVYTVKSTYSINYDWNYDGIAGAGSDRVDAQGGIAWTQSGLAPHDATQTGKTLLGWTLDAAGQGAFVLPGTQFSALAATFCAANPGSCEANGEPKSNVPITLYAQWENASFIVQYDLNGIAAPAGWQGSISVGFDDTGLIPDTSTVRRTGYDLVGWKVSVNAGTTAMVQPGDSYRMLALSGASYITLQAQWVAKSYVVHYDGGWPGAAAIDSTPSTGSGALRWTTAIPFPASSPTRPGYTFQGWELWKRGSGELASPLTVVALANEVGSKQVPYSDLAYADSNDYSSVTLRAMWQENPAVTVTYQAVTLNSAAAPAPGVGGTVQLNGQGGPGSSVNESLLPATGEAVGATATAVPGYYQFVGWYAGSGPFSGTPISTQLSFTPAKSGDGPLNQAATYTAVFDAVPTTTFTLTVQKDSDLQSGLTADQIAVLDSSGYAAAFTPVSEGIYTFSVWQGGTFTAYAFGQPIGAPFVAEGGVTMNASFWTIKYDGAEGGVFLDGTPGVLAAAPMQAGRRFLGWADEPGGLPKAVYVPGAVPALADYQAMSSAKTLFAVWADDALQIDGASGSIVVTKYANPQNRYPLAAPDDQKVRGDGTWIDPATIIADLAVAPAPDVTFSVCSVLGWDDAIEFPAGKTPFDPDWWGAAMQLIQAYNQMPVEQRAAHLRFNPDSPCLTGVTDADGQIVFGDGVGSHGGNTEAGTGLPLGLYVVHECVPGECGLDSTPPAHGYIPAEDYLVSLPHMRPQDAEGEGEGMWLTRDPAHEPAGLGALGEYIVWTYPKNSSVDIHKFADTDEAYTVGSHIHYTIEAPVPNRVALGENHHLDSSIVVDLLGTGLSLPEGMRKHAGAMMEDGTDAPHVTLRAPEGHTCVVDGVDLCRELTFGTDFNVYVAGEGPDGQEFTIELIEDTGLELANQVPEGTLLIIEYDATINQLVGGIEYTQNTATVRWNTGAALTEVPTYFGGVLLHKRNVLTGDAVNGAVFQVYSADPAAAPYCSLAGLGDASSCRDAGGHWYEAELVRALNASSQVEADDQGNHHGAWVFSQCSKDIAMLDDYGIPVLDDEGQPQLFGEAETAAEACEAAGGDWGEPGAISINGLHYFHQSSQVGDGFMPPTCYLTPGVGGSWAARYGLTVERVVGENGESSIVYHDAESTSVIPSNARLGTAYWLVETTVPAGFVPPEGATPVCVTGPLSSVDTYDDFSIGNMPDEVGVRLPFTGEIDKQIPMLFGVMVIIGGFTVYVARTRKANTARSRARRA